MWMKKVATLLGFPVFRPFLHYRDQKAGKGYLQAALRASAIPVLAGC